MDANGKRLQRKGDQESELGSLAAAAGDHADAVRHFAAAREYWRQALEWERAMGGADNLPLPAKEGRSHA